MHQSNKIVREKHERVVLKDANSDSAERKTARTFPTSHTHEKQLEQNKIQIDTQRAN